MTSTIGDPDIVSGLRARADLTTNREDTDFERGIALLDPNTNPRTLITMEMGKEQVGTGDFHWFEDQLFPEVGQINYGTGYNSSATGLVVDDQTIFAIGDVVMDNNTRETMLVTSTAATYIGVIRDYGQSTEGWTALADTIADNDYIFVIGNAFENGHPFPAMRSTKEIDYVNYLQDFRTPAGVTEFHKNSNQRGEQDWPFQLRKAGISHMRKIELATWWGKPYRGDKGAYDSSTGNTAPGVTAGFNHMIGQYGPTNQKLDETDLTIDEFIDFMEYVFQYGSSTKLCFCPPSLRTFMDKVGISKLNTFTKDTLLGMAVSRWLSSHGEVIFVTHKMFTNPDSAVYKYAFFLDAEELKWKQHQIDGATQLREPLGYKETGGTTVYKQEYQTIGGTKMGAIAHHARLRWKTYSLAA